MLFDDKAQKEQMQSAAQYWQSSSPMNRDRLNAVSKLMFNRPFSSLSPTQQNALMQIYMAGQNMFPDALGNPGADFAAVNRAVVGSGGIPAYLQSGDSGYELSVARGSGNMSYAVTQQILMGQEMMMRQGTGGPNLGLTHGLDSSQLAQLNAMIIQQRNGIKPGEVFTYNLSKEITSSKLNARLDAIGDKNTDAKSSLEMARLRKMAKLMEKLEDSGLDSESVRNKSDEELELSIKAIDKTATSGEISAVISQFRGKNSAVTLVGGQLNKDIGDVRTAVSENLAILAKLFKESDPRKLEQYAKGLGIGSLADAGNAGRVQDYVKNVAAMSAATGQNPFDVVAQQAEIAQGLSALVGGRRMGIETVMETQKAGMMRGSKYETFTKEQHMENQTRSLMNAQNEYVGYMRMMRMIDQMGGVDNLSDEQKAKIMPLLNEFNNTTDHAVAERTSMELNRLAISIGGRAVLSRSFTEAAAATYSDEALAKHQATVKGEISREALKGYRSRGGKIDAAEADFLFNAGLDAFGGGAMVLDVLDDINSGDKKRMMSARAMLERSGIDADRFIGDAQKYGRGELGQLFSPLVNEARFSQFSGRYKDLALKDEKINAFLEQHKSIVAGQENYTGGGFISDFFNGLTGAGGLTRRAAIEFGYENMDQSLRNAYSDTGMLVELGQFDEATRELTNFEKIKSGEQKLQGVHAEELANVKNSEQLITLLQSKGFEIATTKEGKIIAGTEKWSEKERVKWQQKYEESGMETLEALGYKSVGGEVTIDGTSYKVLGGDEIDPETEKPKETAVEAALRKALETKEGKEKVLQLARDGDIKANEALAKKARTVVQNLRKEEGGVYDNIKARAASGDEYSQEQLKRFDSIAKGLDEGTLSGIDAIESLGGFVEGMRAMKMSKEQRIAAGLAEEANGGKKIRMLIDGGSFTAGGKLTDKDIEEQQEAFDVSESGITELEELTGLRNKIEEKKTGSANLDVIEKYIKIIAENTTPNNQASSHPGAN